MFAETNNSDYGSRHLINVYVCNPAFCLFNQAIEGCLAAEVDADFVYFGCGLRLLQLIPDRPQSSAALDT